jgi:hypothetical protein
VSREIAVGHLAIVELSGETTTREVSGQTCAQVVDALALVAALAMDPGGLAAPLRSPLPTAPDHERAPNPSGRALARRAQRRWRLSVAAGAEVTGAVPPGLALGIPLFVELRDEPVGPTVAASRARLSLRLGFERTFGASIPTQPGSAQFTWTVGRVDSCAAWQFGKWLTAGPCAGIEAGILEGKGSIAHPLDRSRPWVAVAAILRGRWLVLPPFFLELEAGAVLPLVRDTFVFESPRTVVYEVPSVGPQAGAGLGALFP